MGVAGALMMMMTMAIECKITIAYLLLSLLLCYLYILLAHRDSSQVRNWSIERTGRELVHNFLACRIKVDRIALPNDAAFMQEDESINSTTNRRVLMRDDDVRVHRT